MYASIYPRNISKPSYLGVLVPGTYHKTGANFRHFLLREVQKAFNKIAIHETIGCLYF